MTAPAQASLGGRGWYVAAAHNPLRSPLQVTVGMWIQRETVLLVSALTAEATISAVVSQPQA